MLKFENIGLRGGVGGVGWGIFFFLLIFWRIVAEYVTTLMPMI